MRLIRQLDGTERCALRNAETRHRAMYQQQQLQYAAWSKQMAQMHAAQAVQMWHQRFSSLFVLHHQGVPYWDWNQVAYSPAPVPPQNPHAYEQRAMHAFQSHRPGVLDQLNGKATARKAELHAAVHHARAQDRSSMVAYHTRHRQWQEQIAVAQHVLDREPAIYPRALEITGAIRSLDAFGGSIHVVEQGPAAVNCMVMLSSETIIPAEEYKLTQTGKLSSRKFAKSRFWGFVLEQTASAALRVGRDVLASLPIDRVVVNMCSFGLNPATGNDESLTKLGIHFTRDQLNSFNFQRLSPVDALTNVSHRMSFKKTQGFQNVEGITLDEKWISG